MLATEEQLVDLLQVDTGDIRRWKQRKGFNSVGDFSDRGQMKPLYSVSAAKRELAKDKKKESQCPIW